MSSLAIPAAPPPATANTGNGSAPATDDPQFNDTLQQAKAKPQTQADKGSSDDATATPKHAGNAAKDVADHAGQDDKKTPSDAKQSPAAIATAIPAVPVTPAAARQAPAVSGKSLPAATAATISAAAPQTAPARTAIAPGEPAATANALAIGTPPATSKPPAIKAALATSTAQPETLAPTAADPSASTNTPMPGLTADTHADSDSGKNATPLRLDANNFTAHLSQLIGGQATPIANHAPAPAPAQLTMQATPTQPQFAQETAQHVAWMAGQGIQKAQIQLNPRTLGPIHVDITTHHDHVDVSFAVQHPQTVNALQQTLPQLHDMLAQQGLNLGQASVGQQAPGQHHAVFAQHAGGGNANGSVGNAEPEIAPVWRSARIAAPGGVDDFA